MRESVLHCLFMGCPNAPTAPSPQGTMQTHLHEHLGPPSPYADHPPTIPSQHNTNAQLYHTRHPAHQHGHPHQQANNTTISAPRNTPSAPITTCTTRGLTRLQQPPNPPPKVPHSPAATHHRSTHAGARATHPPRGAAAPIRRAHLMRPQKHARGRGGPSPGSRPSAHHVVVQPIVLRLLQP